eukprot:gnl/Dysnectes_brevis/2423_a2880_2198.p1 GENE.gnl/Dysnectes_brevis/2423_a2880_2198~~gnl/Dysnectes_brevis/2423_a2880_2198.p1  ORF type:complete len:133 (+),score=9.50 gnl/Dysnectes_brevis/2423_a2880_2198:24-401(+)
MSDLLSTSTLPAELQTELQKLKAQNGKLAKHNMKLLLLLKEKDQRLFKCELVIRKYRARLIRWFEDMKHDPLAEISEESEHAETAAEGVGHADSGAPSMISIQMKKASQVESKPKDEPMTVTDTK